MSGKKGIPAFKSLEEEKEYWEARGPLADGHKGRVSKPKPGQKRSSFLVVRLTGEELTAFREIAAAKGLGPSTMARSLIVEANESHGLTAERFKRLLLQSKPPGTVAGRNAKSGKDIYWLPPIDSISASREYWGQFHRSLAQMRSFFGRLGIELVLKPVVRESPEESVAKKT